MTKAVVDHLESIEIEIQGGEPASAMLLEFLEALTEPLDEDRAVAQAGQWIAEPQAAQQVHRGGAFGDIGQRTGDSRRPPAWTTSRDAATQEAPVGTVLMADAMFVVQLLGLPV